MSFTVVIPARFGSSRFPGKPLALIDGKPMIQHVVERAKEAGAENIIVATDDERIQNVVEGFAQVCMTSVDHQSGTRAHSRSYSNAEYLCGYHCSERPRGRAIYSR